MASSCWSRTSTGEGGGGGGDGTAGQAKPRGAALVRLARSVVRENAGSAPGERRAVNSTMVCSLPGLRPSWSSPTAPLLAPSPPKSSTSLPSTNSQESSEAEMLIEVPAWYRKLACKAQREIVEARCEHRTTLSCSRQNNPCLPAVRCSLYVGVDPCVQDQTALNTHAHTHTHTHTHSLFWAWQAVECFHTSSQAA